IKFLNDLSVEYLDKGLKVKSLRALEIAAEISMTEDGIENLIPMYELIGSPKNIKYSQKTLKFWK
ncbi:hypothetical protein, partial [Floricoccus tropicus]|uniref:hypothetical protein n=1 Tax=Floricoccus tropicus TaxID=1859473 RepID=UPI0013013C91